MKLYPNIVYFDMDGTLVDYTGGAVAAANERAAPGERRATHATFWQFDSHRPEVRSRLHMCKEQESWWAGLKPIASGMALVALFRRFDFEVQVLTRVPYKYPQAVSGKIKWCEHHLPGVPVNVTFGETSAQNPWSGKGLFEGRALVDDSADNVEGWLANRAHGFAVVPHCHQNARFRHPRAFRHDGSNTHQLERALARSSNRRSPRA